MGNVRLNKKNAAVRLLYVAHSCNGRSPPKQRRGGWRKGGYTHRCVCVVHIKPFFLPVAYSSILIKYKYKQSGTICAVPRTLLQLSY